MANIGHRNAHEKVAFMALELYQRLKYRGLNNGYTVPFPLSQKDIADTLGLTSVHVNRTLHKLEKENLLSIHKHELTILDYEKLNALVGMELQSLNTCDLLN
jgi:CRP-like cAMP-binding protein